MNLLHYVTSADYLSYMIRLSIPVSVRWTRSKFVLVISHTYLLAWNNQSPWYQNVSMSHYCYTSMLRIYEHNQNILDFSSWTFDYCIDFWHKSWSTAAYSKGDTLIRQEEIETNQAQFSVSNWTFKVSGKMAGVSLVLYNMHYTVNCLEC